MSSWHYITSYFEDGEKEREKGNYMAAARNYRISYMTYDECDAPPFPMNGISDAADKAYKQYWEVCKLLTPYQRWMLMTEKRTLVTTFDDGWNASSNREALIRHDQEMLKQNR